MKEEFLATIQHDLNRSRPYVRDLRQPQKESFTVGLHSRHAEKENDGSNVHEEVQCLDKLLSTRPDESIPCAVFIMSDRPATTQNITNYLQKSSNCASISVSPDPSFVRNLSQTSEHGLFAGAGFFRDLALVSQARSGYVVTARSSSALLVEFMEYKRRSEAWQHGEEPLKPLQRCMFSTTTNNKPSKLLSL